MGRLRHTNRRQDPVANDVLVERDHVEVDRPVRVTTFLDELVSKRLRCVVVARVKLEPNGMKETLFLVLQVPLAFTEDLVDSVNEPLRRIDEGNVHDDVVHDNTVLSWLGTMAG